MNASQAPKHGPELETEYRNRHANVLGPLAKKIELHLSGLLKGVTRVDRVCARAKDVGKFIEKANKPDDSGKLKYSEPLREIQDQVGARITTFFNQDIGRIEELVLPYFSKRETAWRIPESESEFGYVGKHFILNIPPELYGRPFDVDEMPDVFELQIRTLFQHAWAEASHDLAYKPKRELDADEKRRFAFTAAQAWGADMVFDELFSKLGNG